MTIYKHKTQNCLCVLIGAPHQYDISMHNDLIVMHEALRKKGISPSEIISLEGNLDREILLALMKNVHNRIKLWEKDTLFLYVSGHGFFTGETIADARVGLLLRKEAVDNNKHQVYWDEIFEALSIPTGVSTILLPDH